MKSNSSGIEDQSHQGFWALWEVQRGKLMSYCLNLMGGSEEEAKDALSGTLLKALDAWPVNRDRLDNPVGWLFRIAHNHCMDQYREARNRYRSDSDPDELSIRNRDLHPDLPESPEQTFLRREMHVNLEGALAKLPERLQRVMVLRCVKEFSYKEIAEELGLTEANVRKRVQLGREWIKTYLDGYLLEDKGDMPGDDLIAGEGEKTLADNLQTDPYKGLKLQADFCQVTYLQAPNGEIAEALVYAKPSTKRLTQKITAAEKYVKKYPSGWKKRLDLAELYFLSGQWSACLDQIERVLNKNPRLVEARIVKSRVFLLHGDRRKALETLKQGRVRKPKPGVIYLLEGMMALVNRQFSLAARAFRKAVDAGPQQPAFKAFLAQARLGLGDPVMALRTLAKILPEEQGVKVLHLYAAAAGQLASGDQYRKSLEHILEAFPEDMAALEQKVLLQFQAGRVVGDAGKATRALIRAVSKLAPESAVPVALQAEYHHLRGNSAKALETLQSFVDQTPLSLMGRYHLARMHYQLGNEREALLELTCTSGLQSGQYLPPTLLDLCLSAQVEPQPIHLDTSDDWEVLSTHAWLQATQQDRADLAVFSAEALVESRSGWPLAWYRKAWIDLSAGRLPEAQTAFMQAWDRLPDQDGNALRAGDLFGNGNDPSHLGCERGQGLVYKT
jgi:RNA polymerase sigma factor (sigma-70 family)